jgi:phage-related protein
MEAQDAGSACATKIVKGFGRQVKEIDKHNRRGLGRSQCKSSQYHLFVSGK